LTRVDERSKITIDGHTFLRTPDDWIYETHDGFKTFGGAESQLMIKLVYCITKKPGLTDKQFFDYWKNVHGPIGARIPGLRKLVQSHRVLIPEDKHRPTYAGMAELWFDDVEQLLAARESTEWKASSEDETNFIDHSKTAYFVSEEHVVLDQKP
jgi:uncharacterized protein (TIGR02118 family)